MNTHGTKLRKTLVIEVEVDLHSSFITHAPDWCTRVEKDVINSVEKAMDETRTKWSAFIPDELQIGVIY